MRRVVCALGLLLLAVGGLAAQDLSSPEATIRSFLAALTRGDARAASACVSGASPSAGLLTNLQRQMKQEPATITLRDLRVQRRGNTATATMTVNLAIAAARGRSARSESHPDRVSLRREGSAWKIVPVQSRGGFTAGIATLFTARRSERAPIGNTACLSNLKQLAIGAMMFVQDHDMTFALEPVAYKKSLAPYVRNERVFRCPEDRSGKDSYAFNPSLAGVSFRKIPQPSQTVLLYEGANRQLAFRHEGRAAVAFADGSARLIDRDQAKTLRWRP